MPSGLRLPALQPGMHLLYETPLATAIRESGLVFPVIQTVHILGILLMAGTIAVVDLRLLGVLLRRYEPAEVAKPLLPLTWLGFAMMFASGGLLFAAQSEKIYGNFFLQLKFVLLVIAGLNVIVFHSTTYRSIGQWSGAVALPWSAKAAAGTSLLLWAAVIVTGRYIAYY